MRALRPALWLCALLMTGSAVQADTKTQVSIIGLLASEPQWLPAAEKIAAKLDHENGLRIVPMSGVGGVAALQDLANLPLVDVALVASDSLAYAAAQDLLHGQKDKYNYVARLAALDVVLVSRRSIGNVAGLAGKCCVCNG